MNIATLVANHPDFLTCNGKSVLKKVKKQLKKDKKKHKKDNQIKRGFK